jgi:hypothetical protein
MTKFGFGAAAAVGAACAALAQAPAWAHHSHAMFDTSKVLDLAGTVKGYEFANPHVFLYLLVPDPAKGEVLYPVEMSYTQNMLREGIGPKTFKPGDKVQVRIWPLRNGRPGGSYVGAVDAQGGKHGGLLDKPS